MAISAAQYTAWLSDPSAIRCILVEAIARVAGVETTRYISSVPFVSATTDTPASTRYDPILMGNSAQIVERLSLDGESSISFGDVMFDNIGGGHDSWLDDIWFNRAVNCYIGDPRWERADFRLILSGIMGDIASDDGILKIPLLDKLQRLNSPVTETKLGGSTNNKDEILPVCLGEPFNISPLLTDPATLEYQYHQGASERIIEVRDFGVVTSKTDNLAAGKFNLAASTSGRITATVQGDNSGSTYYNTVKKAVQRLVTAYGQVDNRFVAGDLDSTNLIAFDTANPQAIGVYLEGGDNLLATCSALAKSVGAQLVMSSESKLQLIKIELPAPGTPFAITDAHVIGDSLDISERPPVVAAVKVGYCKNWTVQENLQTGIPGSHKDLFAKEWRSVVAENATTKTNYRLMAEPEQIDTLLIVEADATTEANRLLALWGTPRQVIKFTGTMPLIEVNLGDPVTILYPRFGLDPAVDGIVIGRSIDWDAMVTEMEILI